MTRYVLAKDVVIPAGTELLEAPARITYADVDGNPAITSGKPAHFVQALVGPTAGTVYTWVMHIDDALDTGLIKETVAA